MNCPVCNHENAPENGGACPSCGSDLSAYFHVSKAINQRKVLRTLTFLLGGLLLAAVLIMIIVSPPRSESSVQTASMVAVEDQGAELDELRAALEEREQALKAMRSELEAAKAAQVEVTNIETPTPQTQTEKNHIVKAGESLWEIAHHHLGDGHAYEQIANDNGLNNVNHIEVGDTLIIKRK